MTVGMLLGGRYELTASLGRGGFGTVWQAHDRTLDRDVAVKLITLERSGATDRRDIAERFSREARAVAGLNHPNVVTAHDYGVQEDTAYLVMELITGGSLEDELHERVGRRAGPLPVDRVIRLGQQICAGLGAAHGAGLIHRDLKPANIMLAESGQAKIVDFGIAHVGDKSRITHTGMYLGTLRYTSPEQMGGGPVDPRSDLYSLGCMLFELLTVRSPFEAESPVQWIYAHQHATPADLRTYVPDAPIELAILLKRLLGKAPDERPGSAAEVRNRLEQIEHAPNARTVPAPPGPTTANRAIPMGTPALPAPPRVPTPLPPYPPSTPPPLPRGPITPYPASPLPVSPPPMSPYPYAGPPPTGFPPAPTGFPPAPTGFPPPHPMGPWPGGMPFIAGPPPAPPPPVRAAAWTLRSTGFLGVLLIIGLLAAAGAISRDWNHAYSGVATQNDSSFNLGALITGCVVQIALVMLLAVGLRRGRQTVRILAWVFCGLNAFCCIATFEIAQLFTPNSGDVTAGTRLSNADHRFALAFPHWLGTLSSAVGAAAIFLLITTAILLATPSAHAYFRAMTPPRRRP